MKRYLKRSHVRAIEVMREAFLTLDPAEGIGACAVCIVAGAQSVGMPRKALLELVESVWTEMIQASVLAEGKQS